MNQPLLETPWMNICVVEDDEFALENLLAILKKQPDIDAVAGFTTAEDALAFPRLKNANMFIVDLDLPKMSGVEFIQRVRVLRPGAHIIVHTIHEDRPIVLDALKAGACGYLIKGCGENRLVAALHEILSGGAPMDSSITRAVVSEYQRVSGTGRKAPGAKKELTMREQSILRLLEEGLTYKEIAARLFISTLTVQTHIQNIYTKLHAHNKIDAIRKNRIRNMCDYPQNLPA